MAISSGNTIIGSLQHEQEVHRLDSDFSTWTLEKILSLWQILMVFGASGWCVALSYFCGSQRRKVETLDFFLSSLFGIFLIIYFVLCLNFMAPLGRNAGIWMVGVGLVPFTLKFFSSESWRQQVFLFFTVTVLVSLVWRKIGYGYDPGLYHMPYMEWIASYSVPLGLANLEGRLGFNSAWLLFVSGIRVDSILEWRHFLLAEIAIAALPLAWLTHRFLAQWQDDRGDFKFLDFSSLVILLLFLTFLGGIYPGTDIAANVFAFCCWVLFSDAMLGRGEASKASNFSHSFFTISLLATMSVSAKLSLLPILVLPVIFLWKQGVEGAVRILKSGWPWLILLIVFWILWALRGFMLSGCFLYPAASSCLDVSWAVPVSQVERMSSVITAWARVPGPTSMQYAAPFNMDWFQYWIGPFLRSPLFTLCASLIGLGLLSLALANYRKQPILSRASAGAVWVNSSLIMALMGILFWFFKAPHYRFSWAFFAIAGTVMIFHSLTVVNFSMPQVNFPKFANRLKWMVCLGVVFLGSILSIHNRPRPEMPNPEATIVFSANGWEVYKPVAGDQCWMHFPCSPYSIKTLVVERDGARLTFRRPQDTP
jgi:hypothetical protein